VKEFFCYDVGLSLEGHPPSYEPTALWRMAAENLAAWVAPFLGDDELLHANAKQARRTESRWFPGFAVKENEHG